MFVSHLGFLFCFVLFNEENWHSACNRPRKPYANCLCPTVSAAARQDTAAGASERKVFMLREGAFKTLPALTAPTALPAALRTPTARGTATQRRLPSPQRPPSAFPTAPHRTAPPGVVGGGSRAPLPWHPLASPALSGPRLPSPPRRSLGGRRQPPRSPARLDPSLFAARGAGLEGQPRPLPALLPFHIHTYSHAAHLHTQRARGYAHTACTYIYIYICVCSCVRARTHTRAHTDIRVCMQRD